LHEVLANPIFNPSCLPSEDGILFIFSIFLHACNSSAALFAAWVSRPMPQGSRTSQRGERKTVSHGVEDSLTLVVRAILSLQNCLPV